MFALACLLMLSCGQVKLSGSERIPVATSYQTKLANQKSSISRSVTSARKVYDRLGPYLERYKGGMPSGFLAAIASFESGGKMSSTGDSSLGEVGIFQITKTFPSKVGLPANSRFQEENNVFFGGIEYQIMAVEMWLANKRIPLGTPDNWKLARLAFAVGPAGTKRLMHESNAGSWSDLIRYVDRTGGISLGKQSPGKVWFRVRVIDVLWDIGLQVKRPFFVSAPLKLPNPPVGEYRLPKHVVDHIPSPWKAPILVATATGAYLAARKIL